MGEDSFFNKSRLLLDVIPLSNADKLFTARKCYFSPLVIIKRITCFLFLSKLCLNSMPVLFL